jgi:hypothetical protein
LSICFYINQQLQIWQILATQKHRSGYRRDIQALYNRYRMAIQRI